MEIAAIAATPIVRISFQSEARIFNEETPSKRADVGVLPPCTHKIATTARRERLLHYRPTRLIPYSIESLDEKSTTLVGDAPDYATLQCRQREPPRYRPRSADQPCRRAGGDQIPRIQRHHSRHPADQKIAFVSHQCGAARLALLPIHVRFHQNVGSIKLAFNIWAHRTKRIESLGPSELAIGFLQVTRGDIVHAGIAENISESVV